MDIEQERKEILDRVQRDLPEWAMLIRKTDDLKIHRLGGLSNACFKVELSPELLSLNPGFEGDKVVLYRRFESKLSENLTEQRIF